MQNKDKRIKNVTHTSTMYDARHKQIRQRDIT